MSTPSTPIPPATYPARLEVDYPVEDSGDHLFRIVLVIPIAIVYGSLTAGTTAPSTTRAARG